MLKITQYILQNIGKYFCFFSIFLTVAVTTSCLSPFEKEAVRNYKSQNSSSRINNGESNSVKNFEYLDKNIDISNKKSEISNDLDFE